MRVTGKMRENVVRASVQAIQRKIIQGLRKNKQINTKHVEKLQLEGIYYKPLNRLHTLIKYELMN